jgi:transcriptional regulator with XRE-family HTH domain
MRAGLTQQELASRLDLTPGMVSQIENGISRPSVGTLYGVVTELDLSLDALIRGTPSLAHTSPGEDAVSIVVPERRSAVTLDSGVQWDWLAEVEGQPTQFVLARYDVGGSSSEDGSLMTHTGFEYGYVISGTLGIRVGDQDYQLDTGDSIAFASGIPHRLFNPGDVASESVWAVVGGGVSDPHAD